ncbi:hypothetical protein Tco_0426339 [Tanacetum coccineum]
MLANRPICTMAITGFLEFIRYKIQTGDALGSAFLKVPYTPTMSQLTLFLANRAAQEMWEAMERLQQGESSIFKIVKTTYFGSLVNSPLHDGETIECYYNAFYK